MRMILATAILGLSSFETVHAQTVDRIDITEYGIYTTDTAATTTAPGTATGKIDEVANIKLVQSTIRCRRGRASSSDFATKSSGNPSRRRRRQAQRFSACKSGPNRCRRRL